jgi:hypothetical protein
MAEAMGPTNYTESRLKMLIYYGRKDVSFNLVNYQEEIKQWYGVFGYESEASFKDGSTASA